MCGVWGGDSIKLVSLVCTTLMSVTLDLVLAGNVEGNNVGVGDGGNDRNV
jgi:hypothetical protein